HGPAVFPGQAFGGSVSLPGVAGITDSAQFLEQAAQGQLAVRPAYLQAVIGQVEVGLGNAGQTSQVLLDQPAACRTTDAFDQQAGFAQRALLLDEGLLHVGAVVQRQFFGQDLGQVSRVGGGVTAVRVVVLEA